jgi:hypothetical protein
MIDWKIIVWVFLLLIAGPIIPFVEKLTFWQQLILIFAYLGSFLIYGTYLFLWFGKRIKDHSWKIQQKTKLKCCIDKGILPFIGLHGTWIGILFFLMWILPMYIFYPEMSFPIYKLLYLGFGYPVAGIYWFFLKIRYEKMNSK